MRDSRVSRFSRWRVRESILGLEVRCKLRVLKARKR